MPFSLLFLALSIASIPKGTPREQAKTRNPPSRAEQVVNIVHLHTREVLIWPTTGKVQISRETLDSFLRCRFTDQERPMDPKLVELLADVIGKFSPTVVEVVSGYRSERFNDMLRKRLHEVAKNSYHTRGQALDFNIPGVDLKQVMRFLRRSKKAGVGWYEGSEFIHMDTGPVRYWEGN